ncbi:unnamed protein product [Protopolystoma xenopodis]|uniref:Uncharacterized protein n=1 Tax=Protopolystoma xenopodis TaxID=117903 RepID=A0A448WTR2_9PLAT|nr:unnamed protein product [Protopolystoma xenopodis]
MPHLSFLASVQSTTGCVTLGPVGQFVLKLHEALPRLGLTAYRSTPVPKRKTCGAGAYRSEDRVPTPSTAGLIPSLLPRPTGKRRPLAKRPGQMPHSATEQKAELATQLTSIRPVVIWTPDSEGLREDDTIERDVFANPSFVNLPETLTRTAGSQ